MLKEDNNMRKYLLFISIILSSGMSSYGQENINMVEILNIQQDIVSLEKRINQLIKKKPEIAHLQGLHQFHVFWLGSKDNDSKYDYARK